MRFVVPTSTSRAPDCARISGTRNEPPISISWPREITTSRPCASAASASSTPAALLFTAIAACAPVSSQSNASTCACRPPRVPCSNSYSRFEYPLATESIASSASNASGARPRFVCTTTPVALITGTSVGALRALERRDRVLGELPRVGRRAVAAQDLVAAMLDRAPGGVDRQGPRSMHARRTEAARSAAAAPRMAAREAPRAQARRSSPPARVPSTQRSFPPSISFFQIGASSLMRSIISRAPANASPRCAADTATATLASLRATVPRRCSAAAASSAYRSIASLDDRRDPFLGHLPIGLVLELVDVARRALEGDDRARRRPRRPGAPARPPRAALRSRARARARCSSGPSAHGWDQRQLVARAERIARRRRTLGSPPSRPASARSARRARAGRRPPRAPPRPWRHRRPRR